MENALVAVTNEKPVTKALRFRVGLNIVFGDAGSKEVLADSVFYKDGLVMMQGVACLCKVNSSIPRAKAACCQTWKDKNGFVRDLDMKDDYLVEKTECLYGLDYVNAVLDRSTVVSVLGLSSTDTLRASWNKTKDEAQAEADKKETEINDEIKRKNTLNIDERFVPLRREMRAALMWHALPWYVRIFTNEGIFCSKVPASPDDRAWVIAELDKGKFEHD